MNKSRTMAVAVAAVVLGSGLLALVISYFAEAGAGAGSLDRTGPAVAWGLPITKLVFNASAACTVGALVLALFALRPKENAFRMALDLAGISAAVWTAAASVMSFLTFHSLANLELFSDGSGGAFVSFLADVDAGRRGALTILMAAAVTCLCFAVQGQRYVALAAALALAAFFPLALNSHAAGSGTHPDSTVTVVMHMGAAAVWLGGLTALVILRRSLSPDRVSTVVRRYSTLALSAFVALAITGVLAAWAGVGSLEGLASPYGTIIAAKCVAFVVLGVMGALHRRWVINRLDRNPAGGAVTFTVLAVAELAVMGAASGMATAVARTPPPAVTRTGFPEETLTIPSLVDPVISWKPDPLWTLACGSAVFLYMAGTRRLRQQGRTWPPYRSILWVLGIALLFTVTSGGLRVQQEYLISAHVLTQMALMTVIPLLLVPASPLTLASQVITRRTDGTVGGAEVLRSALRPFLAATATPYVPAVGLAAVLTVLYYTPLLEYSSRTQLGYGAMSVLALLSGCLFIASLAGSSGDSPAAGLAPGLMSIGGAAALYAIHGWALSQQPDQQPDSRKQEWLITVQQPWDLSLMAAPEPAGAAMWILAAGTLGVTALLVLLQARSRAMAGHGGHRAMDRSRELVR
ncbi:cytochrome c oxidase assembly protein [Arthrobacter sp. ISL-5]|uniref:cytochrome c oxidase assembly protein n=1 Tax=Arthrobacter sp. ISL-5 TaxID=2819111 RepID=UPI001BE8FAD3|nr:cytochrome c oxidase assembly protein [Arthrobacter sp. ISL-5]MBT2555673.1 bifunctional copper resistance protein CopD/cytochrome c oxidase assembly protein [Arthrobacter sp. ISL-5]